MWVVGALTMVTTVTLPVVQVDQLGGQFNRLQGLDVRLEGIQQRLVVLLLLQ